MNWHFHCFSQRSHLLEAKVSYYIVQYHQDSVTCLNLNVSTLLHDSVSQSCIFLFCHSVSLICYWEIFKSFKHELHILFAFSKIDYFSTSNITSNWTFNCSSFCSILAGRAKRSTENHINKEWFIITNNKGSYWIIFLITSPTFVSINFTIKYTKLFVSHHKHTHINVCHYVWT